MSSNPWRCDPSNPYSCGYQQPQNSCYPGSPGYPNNCYPNSPYQYQNPPTVTVTNYSPVTQTSITTATTSILNPIITTLTLVSITTTGAATAPVYGALMAVFLVLFLAALFLLIRSKSTPVIPPSYSLTSRPVDSDPSALSRS
ncbi:MAG: hypothetical protein ABSF09_11085 [Candidatus Bathyarchaeia archaeon]